MYFPGTLKGNRYHTLEFPFVDSQVPGPDLAWKLGRLHALHGSENSQLGFYRPTRAGVSCWIAAGTMHVGRFKQKTNLVSGAHNPRQHGVVKFDSFALHSVGRGLNLREISHLSTLISVLSASSSRASSLT